MMNMLNMSAINMKDYQEKPKRKKKSEELMMITYLHMVPLQRQKILGMMIQHLKALDVVIVLANLAQEKLHT